MMEQTIVIGLLARDCAEALQRNISRVEELGSCFRDYHVVAYENDSRDGTADLLRTWQQRNPHILAICETSPAISTPAAAPKCRYPQKSIARIERMARLRNRVLDEVRQRFSPDLFCFIDIDIAGFSPATIADAVCNAPDDWGGLFANGRLMLRNDNGDCLPAPFQYDAYAYVPIGTNPMQTGCWLISNRFHDTTAWTFNNDLLAHRFLPCRSAFNGIGIYRWSAISHLRYRTQQTPELAPLGVSFCEHVPFHGDVISQNYGLYVVRDMEVTYGYKRRTLIRRFDYWRRILMVRLSLALHL